MRGFQPVGVKSQKQSYADGGVVSRIKGAFGFGKDDKAQTSAPSPAPAPATTPAPAPAPAPAPEPKTAIGQYAAGTAFKRRMAEIDGYANGGPVRGKGTGISDDVSDTVPEGTYIMPTDSTEAIGEKNLAVMGRGNPVDVQLSNGEFKLPPEQVHAVGVQALDQMKNATHEPVAARGFAPGAQQQQAEPPLFFANGGVVDEENRRRFVQVPDTIGTQPSRQQPVMPAASSAPPAQPGMTDAQRATALSQIPTESRAGPAPALTTPSQPTASAAQPPTTPQGFSYQDNNQSVGREIKESWNNGQYGRAIGQTIAGTVGGITTPAIDLAAKGGSTAWDGAKGFVSGIFGGSAPAPQPSSPAAATSAPAPNAASVSATAPAPGYSYRTQGDMGPPDLSRLPAATVPAEPQASQVMPGVYRSGNSYGDTAASAMAGAQPRGLPSAQNNAAAEVLAQRSQQESAARIASGQTARGFAAAPSQPQTGWTGVIGTDPRVDRERQDLVSSLTTPLRGAQNGQLTAAQRNGMLQLRDQEARGQQAVANNETTLQQTAMHGNTQRDVAAMREAGDDGRAVLREAGETGRSGARNALDKGRLDLEQQVRGFDIRSGERQEKLYQKYDAAKTTEEKAAISQQIRDLSGKQPESPWKIQVTPSTKNVDGSTNEGSIYRYNSQTGAVEQVDASQGQSPAPMPAKDQLKAGTVYQTPRGAARWDGKQFTPV